MYLPISLAAEAEIGFTETVLSVNEGVDLSVCLQLTGMLQAPVVVNIIAIPVTAEGKMEEWI